jgi:ElaB/YqjD/DUF883 family membrane-anchored ribosome-binding protein
MRQLVEDLPVVQDENEEEIEKTAPLRELLYQSPRPHSIRSEMGRSLSGLREQLSEGQEQVGARATAAVGRTSEYLREHRANEVLDDVQGYVRKHPVQAIGGAVVTGLVIGRLLK